jgi:hypothetical protein
MSKVSRSVYQKLKEENKRLLRDIEILVGPVSMERINMYKKWQAHFRDEKEFIEILKSVANDMVLKNPEKYPDYLVDKAKENKTNPEID